MYSQLLAFRERFGHCRVPDRWPENVKLANWVSHQRRKADKLPPGRREKLEQIGFFN
ncbi:MAG: helicase associated domain-containing protein, partial [Cytophagales bacterium]|nr:helicase associated domain-containing protein [Cytophagales bacterium]